MIRALPQLGIAARLAADTCRAIVYDPPFGLALVGVAVLLPVSAELTLFSLGARALLIRETSLASLLLGGLVITLLADRYRPGEDLREGPGPAILASPVHPFAYSAGRLAGLGLALAGATVLWLGVLALVLRVHDAGPLNLAMIAAAGLGVVELLMIGAVLQRLSLWLPSAPTAAAGALLYLVGHVAGLLAIGAGPALRILPNLAAIDLTTPAALGDPIPASVIGLGLTYGTLYALAFVCWTADGIGRLGSSVR